MKFSKFPIATTPTKVLAMDTKNVNTKTVIANGVILAIDLGKYKSVVCTYEPAEPSWQLSSFTLWPPPHAFQALSSPGTRCLKIKREDPGFFFALLDK